VPTNDYCKKITVFKQVSWNPTILLDGRTPTECWVNVGVSNK